MPGAGIQVCNEEMDLSALEKRLETLSDKQRDGKFVAYWMQSAQRAEQNPALEFAIWRANQLGLPVVVFFILWEDFPEANWRHFDFMLRGLEKTAGALRRRKLAFVLARGEPLGEFSRLTREAAEVVLDRGYLRDLRALYREVPERFGGRVYQVEGEAVIPVERVSDKAEYAARTIRPKVKKWLEQYLDEFPTITQQADLYPCEEADFNLELKVPKTVRPVEFVAGTVAARRRFGAFLEEIGRYDEQRSNPEDPVVSMMSPYLHFGQISPVWLARQTNHESFLEELTVRRSLAQNFVYYTPDYDQFSCLPEWARTTLLEHKDDPREVYYTARQLERGQTHDEYWNAAQHEMVNTGYMHNHMRMYWGKQILTWTNTPEYAYRVALELNNRYFLDGRDPNAFANIGWLFGLHDRPWKERPIFGKVRCMTRSGLERKCDPDAYVDRVRG